METCWMWEEKRSGNNTIPLALVTFSCLPFRPYFPRTAPFLRRKTSSKASAGTTHRPRSYTTETPPKQNLRTAHSGFRQTALSHPYRTKDSGSSTPARIPNPPGNAASSCCVSGKRSIRGSERRRTQMPKYYEAYEIRYRQVHGKNLSWASDSHP